MKSDPQLHHLSKLYRYTTDGEGIFSAGKRLLPDELVNEVLEAKKWLPKPNLPEGDYKFFLTEEGKNKYEASLLEVHKKYLQNIKCEEVEDIEGEVVYKDDWQVVIKK